jgi:hypothetical protein
MIKERKGKQNIELYTIEVDGTTQDRASGKVIYTRKYAEKEANLYKGVYPLSNVELVTYTPSKKEIYTNEDLKNGKWEHN